MKMTKVRIRVTQKDIDGGCKGEGDNCPFVLAIGRVLANGYRAGVGNYRVYYKHDYSQINLKAITQDTFKDIPHSVRVSSFIKAYDAGQSVSPMRVTMTMPKMVLKRTYRG